MDSARYTVYDTTKLKYCTSTGVSTPTINTGARFWSATVSHTMIPGFSCGVSVNTANPITTVNDGEPVCK